MKKTIWLVGLIFLSSVSNAYEDRASLQVKKHMLMELYQQIGISKIISGIERNVLMPAIKDVEGWGDSEHQCIMRDVHASLKDPIFEALLKQVPSELIAENVMFYQTEFGKKVDAVVIHGSGLPGLDMGEQAKLKQNTAVFAFLSQLKKVSHQTILDNMKPTLKPAILACTPEP